ncbi:tRNA pseudouridine(38-40) synthase TruA [Phaeacidiphilus oryzae]|uniref:tRNA pseudouridine(38-40) synthase TruA n=1 Tax=Phaeacidiphilus oryzae TaxID=348818 RepID=UPI00056C4132|nr:tRNA pseudouridine(38-40) synthase TruA [Phaeacidiphilus oryzae]
MVTEERPGEGLVRVRLDLAYEGTEFSGWARQPGRRTVQGELESAIPTVLRMHGETVELTVAGRTDAGVHARGQVAHVDLPLEVFEACGEERLLRRLAGRLPWDVRVWRVSRAAAGFDARFSAVWRRYAYRVCDQEAGVDPLMRRHVLWHDRPLDVDRMNEAASALRGEHDFAAYCKRREGATTIRELLDLRWEREASTGFAVAAVRADAFCHNMVRALVGAMLAVGGGQREVSFPGEVLAAGVRDSRVHVVRPHGLTLEEVGYPADSALALRAAEARRVRSLSLQP